MKVALDLRPMSAERELDKNVADCLRHVRRTSKSAGLTDSHDEHSDHRRLTADNSAMCAEHVLSNCKFGEIANDTYYATSLLDILTV